MYCYRCCGLPGPKTIASEPYKERWYLWPFYPALFLGLVPLLKAFGGVFKNAECAFRTWVFSSWPGSLGRPQAGSRSSWGQRAGPEVFVYCEAFFLKGMGKIWSKVMFLRSLGAFPQSFGLINGFPAEFVCFFLLYHPGPAGSQDVQ